MNYRNLDIPIEALSKGGKIFVTEVTPDYPFVNGTRDTTKPIGQRVRVVFPNNNYEDQVVRVANTVDNLSALMKGRSSENPLCVEFVGFSAGVYSMKAKDGRWVTGVSAKAADVKPVFDDSLDIPLDD